MSMKKIAEIAGVSVATVSKAFRNSKEISPQRRRQIFDVAKELGVYEKYAAEKFGKKVIAVICPEMQGGYYNKIVHILQKKIAERNGVMIVSVTAFDAAMAEELYVYHTRYQKADGVLLMCQRETLENPLLVPTVHLGCEHEMDSVSSGFKEALDDIVRMCKENGHKTIAFLGESLTISKQKAFEKAMEKVGMWVHQEMLIVSKLRFEEAGRDGIRRLLAQGKLPEAIVAAYDQIAIGAIQELRENGLSVPEDISVIGMNDIEACDYLETPLTTVKLDMEDLCDKALEILYRKMDNRFYSSKENVQIKSQLVQRESVKKKR